MVMTHRMDLKSMSGQALFLDGMLHLVLGVILLGCVIGLAAWSAFAMSAENISAGAIAIIVVLSVFAFAHGYGYIRYASSALMEWQRRAPRKHTAT